jgi:phage/plasmid-associated DNA primase
MFADELIWGGKKQSEGVLKALITEDSFMLERKGFDSYRIKNYMRLMVASNESWAVPAGSGERRWCICDCNSKFKDDYAFFADLERQMLNGGLEAMMHDLLHRQITTNQRKAPRTAALTDIAVKGFTPIEKWIFNKLEKQGSSFGYHFDPSSQIKFTGVTTPISWGNTLTADELHADYNAYCEHNKIRSPETKGMLCKKTKHLLGLSKPTRPYINGIKTSTYKLPVFSTARDEFAKAVDLNIDWD